MKFTVVTILPELIEPSLTAGVVGRAREAGTITVDTVNPRDFTHDRHRTVDDNPYGGGPGMVMKAEPLLAAIARASEPAPLASAVAGANDSTAPATAIAGATDSAPPATAVEDTDDIATTMRFSRPFTSSSATEDITASGLSSSKLAPDDITTTRPFTRPPRPPGAEVSASLASVESSIDKLEHALDGNLDALVAQDALETATEPATPPEAAPERSTSSGVVAPGTPSEPNRSEPGGAAPSSIGAEIKIAAQGGPSGASGAAGAAAPSSIGAEIKTAVQGGPSGTSGGAAGPATIGAEIKTAAQGGPSSTSGAAGAVAPSSIGAEIKIVAQGGPSSASGVAGAAAPSSIGAEIKIEARGRAHRILLSPSGKPLTQARVRELANLPHLVLVCGRYEGIDQRVIDAAIDEEISIGDFVLSGGELGALVIIDAVSRYVPGVLGAAESVDEESFSAGMLEYPQYTRPPELAASHVPSDRAIERTIPPILQSGNHAAIAAWRRKQSIERTAVRRPDLFRSFQPTKADRKLVPPLRARTHLALVHHPVVDRVGTVITTALTNFDIHDLARSTMTFGLAGYHIVTPITSQREKAEHIARLWSEDEQGEHRAAALRLIRTAATVEDVIATITADHGQAPTVVATSAKPTSFPAALRRTTTELLAETAAQPAPVLILLGTGWGLADSLIPSVSRVLAPIEGGSDWNHLSVRSAGAIILDRLFGRPA